MPSFKTGYQVQLKSGGPPMTVTGWTQGPEGQELVDCEWQDDGIDQRDTFLDEELEHAS